jgi:hypothetical protein
LTRARGGTSWPNADPRSLARVTTNRRACPNVKLGRVRHAASRIRRDARNSDRRIATAIRAKKNVVRTNVESPRRHALSSRMRAEAESYGGAGALRVTTRNVLRIPVPHP